MTYPRCPQCPRTSDPVPPDGPKDAKVMFIGEAPGRDEKAKGRPFVGKAGAEFNEHYLPLAGLNRDEVYITNTVKCWWANSGDAPPDEVIESCRNFHVRREVNEVKPEIIVPMGAIAARNLGSYDLEYQHGLPLEASVYGHACVAYPVYHPASGLHQTSRILPLREDFKRLRGVIDGTYEHREDRHPVPLYSLSVEEINWDTKWDIAVDTEDDGRGGLWCITYSQEPGVGRMVRPGSHSFDSLVADLSEWPHDIWLHNMVFDTRLLEKSIGLRLPPKRVKDTMMLAYHRGYQQKSLKYLAWKLLGIRMQEYGDVVTPHSSRVMREYLEMYECYDWPKPPVQRVMKDGEEKDYKPQAMSTKFKRLFTDLCKSPDMDLFERVSNWSEDEIRQIQGRMGVMPVKSIEHVPFEQALTYAARDARATWELKEYFLHEEMNVRRERL